MPTFACVFVSTYKHIMYDYFIVLFREDVNNRISFNVSEIKEC